ncbi:MAG TPA: hypothetical protein VNZ64_26350 [Candidatus Acidoferrum sp.]|nr:hypothetical protein [Candidatus Acidoferrum sp.]
MTAVSVLTNAAVAAAPATPPPPQPQAAKVQARPPPSSWPTATNIPRFTLPVLEVGKLPGAVGVNPGSTDQSTQGDLSWGGSADVNTYSGFYDPRLNTAPLENRVYFPSITNRYAPPAVTYPALPSRTIVKPPPGRRQNGPGKSALNLEWPSPPNGPRRTA